MDHGQRHASYDTSLVVSGGVDCGRIRRNVYDNKTLLLDVFVLLKLTTDRHEALRGFFATAELLVQNNNNNNNNGFVKRL